MDYLSNPLFWLALGLALIISELVVSGFVVMFLGFSAVVVATLLQFSIISSWMAALTLWLVVSIILIASLRSFLQGIFPGETSTGSTDDDAAARGSICVAITPIANDHAEGQILFRDSTWSAQSLTRSIPSGARVKLVTREGLVWFVEPVTEEKN